MKRKIIIVVIVLALMGAGFVKYQQGLKSSSQKPAPAAQGFNKNMYSLKDANSIWVVANKKRPLPTGFVPNDLTVPKIPLRLEETAEEMHISKKISGSLEQMVGAAKQQAVDLMLASGYRSEAYQRQLYNGYVKSDGQAYADISSARPGTSEHQTGLAVDFDDSKRTCETQQCFGDTPAGKWLAQNAYKYGFIMRYTADKQSVTGYEYEPWHFRYVGKELSTEMHNKNISTLEEFFGLGAAPDYSK
jgi:D-alanyl-D-alanine carboxypeptidase